MEEAFDLLYRGKCNVWVQLRMLSELEMRGCEARWTERNNLYKEMLLSGEVM